MEKEFNLSKEIIGCDRCLGSWIKTEKVKEFIKRLKEEINNYNKEPRVTKPSCMLIINLLAGDKLK